MKVHKCESKKVFKKKNYKGTKVQKKKRKNYTKKLKVENRKIERLKS